MDVEFLDRMSQVSKRVRHILEESENLKELLAKRIAKRAEKAVAAAEEADEIQADASISDETLAKDDDSCVSDESDESDDSAVTEPEQEQEPENGLVADNELSAFWNCLCGRRR